MEGQKLLTHCYNIITISFASLQSFKGLPEEAKLLAQRLWPQPQRLKALARKSGI